MKTIKCGACHLLLIFCFIPAISFSQSDGIQGKMKGVVELGSDGFNSFIITIDKDKNWQLEKAEYGNSNVIEGVATKESVLAGLKAYIKKFVDFGVDGSEIHFVASSGAMVMKSTVPVLEGLKSLGYIVNTVTPEEEGILGYLSVMPKNESNRAFVIDVGAGNTKISWMEDGEILTKATFGAKYYLEFVDDEDAYEGAKEITQGLNKKFGLKAYVIGGVPYKFAKRTRQGKEKLTTLAALESYEPENEKQTGGQKILQGIRDGIDLKKMVFNWDSNFTIGFLIRLPY